MLDECSTILSVFVLRWAAHSAIEYSILLELMKKVIQSDLVVTTTKVTNYNTVMNKKSSVIRHATTGTPLLGLGVNLAFID
jgi:hypothetical protein